MSNPTIQQSQIGVPISVVLFNTGTFPLSGSTNTIVITSPSNIRNTYAAEIEPTLGQSVFFETTGNEFPEVGSYEIQVETTYAGDGQVYYSPIQRFLVKANL